MIPEYIRILCGDIAYRGIPLILKLEDDASSYMVHDWTTNWWSHASESERSELAEYMLKRYTFIEDWFDDP